MSPIPLGLNRGKTVVDPQKSLGGSKSPTGTTCSRGTHHLCCEVVGVVARMERCFRDQNHSRTAVNSLCCHFYHLLLFQIKFPTTGHLPTHRPAVAKPRPWLCSPTLELPCRPRPLQAPHLATTHRAPPRLGWYGPAGQKPGTPTTSQGCTRAPLAADGPRSLGPRSPGAACRQLARQPDPRAGPPIQGARIPAAQPAPCPPVMATDTAPPAVPSCLPRRASAPRSAAQYSRSSDRRPRAVLARPFWLGPSPAFGRGDSGALHPPLDEPCPFPLGPAPAASTTAPPGL